MIFLRRLVSSPIQSVVDVEEASFSDGGDFDLFNPDDSDVESVVSCTTTATKLGSRVTEKLATLTASVQDINSAVVKNLAEGFDVMGGLLQLPGVEKKELLKELSKQVNRVSKLATQVNQIESNVTAITSENEALTDRCALLQEKLLLSIHYVQIFSESLDGKSLAEAKSIAKKATFSIANLQSTLEPEYFSDHLMDVLAALVLDLKVVVSERGDLSFGIASNEADTGAYGVLNEASLKSLSLSGEKDLKETYYSLRTEVHAGFSGYMDDLLESLVSNPTQSNLNRVSTIGRRVFSEQRDGWAQFLVEIRESETVASGDKRDALTLLAQQVLKDTERCEKLLGHLSAGSSVDALQSVFKGLAAFVTHERDAQVPEFVADMKMRAESFVSSRYAGGMDVSVSPVNLRNHILLGDLIFSIPGLSPKYGIAKAKAENLVGLLDSLSKQANSDGETPKLTWYRLVYNIQSFFDKGMVKQSNVLNTPKKK